MRVRTTYSGYRRIIPKQFLIGWQLLHGTDKEQGTPCNRPKIQPSETHTNVRGEGTVRIARWPRVEYCLLLKSFYSPNHDSIISTHSLHRIRGYIDAD